MREITDVREYAITGKFDITTSIRADKDSVESKTVTLRFNLNSVPLQDVLIKSLSTARISWQNGPGRSKFNSWRDRSVIEVDFTSPAKKLKTREESITEALAMFLKAGVPKDQAEEMAVKVVDNPELIVNS